MEETINLVTWHLTCKNAIRGKTQIRSIDTMDSRQEHDFDDIECRRLGHRYVTEERLNQFGRDMKESMTMDIVNSVGEIIEEKMKKPDETRQRGDKWFPKDLKDKQQKTNNIKCYSCNKEGHYSRECSNKKHEKKQIQTKPLNF